MHPRAYDCGVYISVLRGGGPDDAVATALCRVATIAAMEQGADLQAALDRIRKQELASQPRADIRMSDDDYMRLAIEQARRGDLRPGANPIGCVIVRDGHILAEGCNEVDANHDPTSHAEIVTMRRACAALGVTELRGATLYSTLQPCGMCSMASIWAKIGRIVYGAERHQVHAMYFEDRHLDTMDFIHDAFKDDIRLRGGVRAAECAALYVGPDEDIPVAEQVNR